MATTRLVHHASRGMGRPVVTSAQMLTCDHSVTYQSGMGDDLVFRALADPTRRALLDALFETDGQSVGALSARFPELTRFAVMKHLAGAGGGQPDRHPAAGPVDAALSQPGADRPAGRAVDQQVRGTVQPQRWSTSTGTSETPSRRSTHVPTRARLPDLHRRDPGAGLDRDHRLGVDGGATSTARRSPSRRRPAVHTSPCCRTVGRRATA